MAARTLIRSAMPLALLALLLTAFAGCGRKSVPIVEGEKDKKGGKSGDADGDGKRAVGVSAPGKHALLIGVAEYENQTLGNLKYTENDVEVLAEALKQDEAGFASIRVLTATRGKDDEASKPTAANVKKALAALLENRKKGDTVLIALAGHGVTLEVKDPDEKEQPKSYPFFCPSDADLFGVSFSTGQSKSLVNLDELFSDLGRCGAGTKLVLMDACRNQVTVKAGKRNFDAGAVRIPRNVAALYSCGQGQFAHETPKLGKGHGVFFYFVAKGLEGAAKNDEGQVTWASLSDYATRQVSRRLSEFVGDGARQSPAAMGSLEGESPVLVAKGKAPAVVADGAKDRSKDKDGAVVVDADKDKVKPATNPKIEYLENSVKMKLAKIPAGKFQMGSPDDEKDREGDEHKHEVTITKSFYIGVYEVTQEDWVAVMGKDNHPSHWSMTGGGAGVVKGIETDRFPVDSVSWEQAVEFCQTLNKLKAEKAAGRKYRLPTEAEWEYACRAGTDTVYNLGDTISTKTVNMGYDSNSPGQLGRTEKVGLRKPNAFGLYDMHGNVAEWCQDWYEQRYYKTAPAENPPGPEAGTYRVVRGGAYRFAPDFARSARRWYGGPKETNDYFGFRIVCEIEK